jgi:hypothetical protein
MPGTVDLKELPDEGSPDYFRSLVRNCIETYKSLPSDAMCLDYNKVPAELRAMVLDDAEYRRETRNIYAGQRLDELSEIENLMELAVNGGDEDDPRDRARRKKSGASDKDLLTMRFKAAQMRRELIASLNEDGGALERDAANFMFAAVTREEIERNVRYELYRGDSDGGLDELAGGKEEAPEGAGGKLRGGGRTSPLGPEDFFETLPGGEIVER